MDRVLRHFQIGNLDAAGWEKARQLPFADFEDAVVATVAEPSLPVAERPTPTVEPTPSAAEATSQALTVARSRDAKAPAVAAPTQALGRRYLEARALARRGMFARAVTLDPRNVDATRELRIYEMRAKR